MAISTINVTVPYDVKAVWDIVTSLDDYAWRSDLGKITRLNEKQFIECTRDGFETTFTITCMEEYKRWEFDMENVNMKGHWTGVFSVHDAQTTIDFTENVTAKKVFMKPFVGMYLKKQQTTYIQDLKKALEEND